GNSYTQRPDAFGHAYAPATAHSTVRHWDLRNDAAFGNVGTVELVFHKYSEADAVRGLLRLSQRQSLYVWDARFTSVNREAHGHECREERDQQKNERARDPSQVPNDAPFSFRRSHRATTAAACG